MFQFDNEDEYESLPNNASPSAYLMAGACAGIMEHSLMYPVDCIKTRMQCILHTTPRYSGLYDGLKSLIFKDGIKKSFKGIGIVVGASGPAHALYFLSYEQLKKHFINADSTYFHKQISYIASGSFATIFHDALMTPADAIKQRLQLQTSPYSNSIQCLHNVIKFQGFSVLYRAYSTQLLMNVPTQSTHFVVYEFCQQILNPKHDYKPLSHCISGAIAGSLAALISTPLDVCKTILNTHEECHAAIESCSSTGCPKAPSNFSGSVSSQSRAYKTINTTQWKPTPVHGLMGAAKLIFNSSGTTGFFRGWQARVLFQMPGAAISWSVYEYFKWRLS